LTQPLLWRVLLVSLSATSLTFGAANVSDEIGPSPELAAPSASKVRFSVVAGGAKGQTPTAPGDFIVQKFAAGLISPGGLRAAQRRRADCGKLDHSGSRYIESGNTTTERSLQHTAKRQSHNPIRDADGDGTADLRRVFLQDINQTFGMALIGNSLTWPTRTPY
jgi:glucose/arabinose dehydrogenase